MSKLKMSKEWKVSTWQSVLAERFCLRDQSVRPRRDGYCATKAAVRALTEGLRMELHSQNIRFTMISPGAVATELPESSSEEATRKNLREFYKMAIPADSVARAIAYAIEQPAEVEIDEVVIRPTAQDF